MAQKELLISLFLPSQCPVYVPYGLGQMEQMNETTQGYGHEQDG